MPQHVSLRRGQKIAPLGSMADYRLRCGFAGGSQLWESGAMTNPGRFKDTCLETLETYPYLLIHGI